MPHKLNADRHDKIPKQKQQVTNWAEYDEGLRGRRELNTTSNDAWWSIFVLGFGYRALPDAEHDFQAPTAPDPRLDTLYRQAAGCLDYGAAFHDYLAQGQ
jgi:hypothetical protein